MKLQTNRDFVILAFLVGIAIAIVIGAMYSLVGEPVRLGTFGLLIVIGGLYGFLGIMPDDEQRFLTAMVALIVSAVAAQVFLGPTLGGRDFMPGIRLWPILTYITTLILSSGLVLSLRIMVETASKGMESKK